jgi:hypothetical protein
MDVHLRGRVKVITKSGTALPQLLGLLETLEPLDEVFPDIDKDLLPLDGIEL